MKIKRKAIFKKFRALAWLYSIAFFLIFLLPVEKIDLPIKMYQKYDRVYSDRSYIDQVGALVDEYLYLVQIPRHLANRVYLITDQKISEYRLIGSKNNNDYYKSWHKLEEKVFVEGNESDKREIVFRELDAGLNILRPNGPYSADPILIKLDKPHKSIYLKAYFSLSTSEVLFMASYNKMNFFNKIIHMLIITLSLISFLLFIINKIRQNE